MSIKIVTNDINIRNWQTNLGKKAWPEFMQHDQTAEKYWPNLYSDFPDQQFACFENEILTGVGNAISLYYDKPFDELPQRGFDWAIEKANEDMIKNKTPNLLVGLQILINKNNRGKGLSYKMLDIMKSVAENMGIKHIGLPLRPTLKSRYPLIPIHDYINWTDESGQPFDPWLRVHIKAGGNIVGICNESMLITGSVSEWQNWTNLEFPGSGDYIIDGALVPVSIDKEQDIGINTEPNVWVIHEI